MGRRPLTEDIFRERFEDRYIPEPTSGCWLWLGNIIKSRKAEYGQVSRLYKQYLAHRMSYELYKGTIPDGYEVDHLCRNTLCVNPDHLEAVTPQVNSARSHPRKYGNACRRGHPRNEENVWHEKNGQPHCRKCHAMTQLRWKKSR